MSGVDLSSLMFREGQILRGCENVMLRKIFGLKRENATRDWKRLHVDELQGLFSSPTIIRVIKSRKTEWAGHVARMESQRVAHRVLVGKS
jgi:hypothetical protein